MAQTKNKIADAEKLLFRFERAKYGIQQLVERVGFFGILAAARSSLLSSSSSPHPPPFQHSKPPFRPGRNHLRALPGSLLDFLRRHPHWKGCDQDAHSGGAVFSSRALLSLTSCPLSESLRHPSFQQGAFRGGCFTPCADPSAR